MSGYGWVFAEAETRAVLTVCVLHLSVHCTWDDEGEAVVEVLLDSVAAVLDGGWFT